MKQWIATLAGIAAAVSFAPAAGAATFVPGDPEFTISGNPYTGPVSATYGRSGLASGTFTDLYEFTIGADGLGSGAINTILSGELLGSVDLDLLEVIFNNGSTDYAVPIIGTGTAIELGGVANVPITGGVLNTLSVKYLARGNGAYSGTLTFVPGAVPEPATWALMILGFAAVGFAMRRNRKETVRVRYAL